MYDIRHFSLKDMAQCSSALRSIGADAATMEEVAQRIVQYLYDHLLDGATGEKSLVLARVFKTHPYEELDESRRALALKMLGGVSAPPEMKCLTLLATVGVKAEWNSRRQSTGHQTIPLPSEQFVDRFPMIRQLIQQLGVEVNTLLLPDAAVLADMAQTTYNVFYVPNAVGNQYVPAQEEFVIPYGVRSVIGFGGVLPSGNLFAVIMFSRTDIPKEAADMFKTLALSVKLALLPFVGKAVFA